MNKNSRVVVKMVPWYNKAEFVKVYKNLYKDDITSRQWALNRIAVWNSRCCQILPTGIEVTALFIQAIIYDVLMENTVRLASVLAVKSQYMNCFTRFVNMITNLKQDGKKKTPIRILAKRLGISDLIITLRNDSSHGNMPGLSILREGAEEALSWLKTDFWEKEISSTIDWVILDNSIENKIEDLISSFQKEQYDLLYFVKGRKAKIAKRKLVKHINGRIKASAKAHCKKFLKVFLKPGLFISTAANLEIMLTDDEMPFVNEETVELPESLKNFWDPIIGILNDIDRLQEFMEELLACQSLEEPLHQRVAVSWALRIIQIVLSDDDSFDEANIISSSTNFDWIKLLAPCLHNCCKYTPILLPPIIESIDPPFTEDQKNHVMGLVAIKLGALTDCAEYIVETPAKCDNLKYFTLKDLKQTIAVEEAVRSGKSPADVNKCVWTEAPDDIDWSQIPLGAFLGESDDDENESIEDDNENIDDENNETDGVESVENGSDVLAMDI